MENPKRALQDSWQSQVGDAIRGKNKAESCVEFSTSEEAAAAIAQLQGLVMRGKPIQVDVWNWWKPQQLRAR